MAADNVLALFLLPLFGTLSDRINTPIGKRMPFILAGTGSAFIFLLLLPVADRLGNLWLFITALFFVLLSMGLYSSSEAILARSLFSGTVKKRTAMLKSIRRPTERNSGK